MPHVPDVVIDPEYRARLTEIQRRLDAGLAAVDPHRRLAGRPVQFRVVSGRMLEITFRDVPSIAEGELAGVKRLLGEGCFVSVLPHTAETLTVRFVVSLA